MGPEEWIDALANKELIEACIKGMEEYTDGLSCNSACVWEEARDKFWGCLIGGAAGDALGHAVEFLSKKVIFAKYGKKGITEYLLHDGKAFVSDDTQMTLFTANGLLFGTTGYIVRAYLDWYKTQFESYDNCKQKHTTVTAIQLEPSLPAIFWVLIWAWPGFLRNPLRIWN